jgi:beta-lactamase regulating signal transducer with metallopeptidase domain/peroxiredoxin
VTILETIHSVATWLFYTSLKATIVFALILFVQIAFRTRLSAKWQHALWFLLIARLLIPVDVPMPFSIFNLAKEIEPSFPHSKFENSKIATVERSSNSLTGAKNSYFNYPEPIKSEIHVVPTPRISLSQLAAGLWLFTALFLFAYTLASNIKLHRRLRRAKIIDDPEVVSILHRCEKRLGVTKNIIVVSMNSTSSPFWFGIFNPHIVFPTTLLDTLSAVEIEHIFMHELVHYKQKDVPLALLATILQILHWFNPFIWIAFFKMRADREAACDELVLTIIGKDQNKQYGRTLISLTESASQRGLLPVAVGLADTKFNMKRRVTMISNYSPKSMWWTAAALLLISTIAAVALTSAQSSASISGAISFKNGATPDSIHIGLYRDIPHDWPVINRVGEPKQFLTLAKPNYSFDVKPGRYTIAAWAFGYERAYAEIVVPEQNSRIKIDFDLARKSLPGPVTEVKLTGDFCDWDEKKAPIMTKSGRQWIAPPAVAQKKGSTYKFIVSGQVQHPASSAGKKYTSLYRYFPGNSSVKIVKDYATFNHVYSGGRIIFDPEVYDQSAGKAKITVRGFDLYDQFTAVQDSLRNFEIYYHDMRQECKKESLDYARDAYATLKARFERLEKQFDPFFAPIFHEYWLRNLLAFHPSRIEAQQRFKSLPFDSVALAEFLDNSTFVPYFKSVLKRFESLEPNSVLIDGDFWESIRYIRMYSRYMPTLYERLGIDDDYLFNFVIEFCKKTKNDGVKQELLYHMADTYASEKPYDFDKARVLIEWLYRDLPDSWYIEHASAENIRNRLKMEIGQPAPSFTISTLKDQQIHLEGLKGKFVFLEFWGSSCGPCRGESPNMIKLSQSIPQDSLVLIGLGDADEQKARAFVNDQKLTYANAIAPRSVLQDYGITYYPATFLIDPQGKILAKDLKGATLLEDVREQMRMYAAK